MNGVRVTQMVLSLVGGGPARSRFRVVLLAVKEWARLNGIYSNMLGFLGGVNYAILVACVCQRYPNAAPSHLLRQFFVMFADWRWPTPVALCPVQSSPPPGWAPQQVWCPARNRRDAFHLMPIITPCYPSMNSAYNVGAAQLRRIKFELER